MNTYFRVKKYNWTSRKPNLIGHEAYTRKMIPRDLRDVEIDKVTHRYVWNKPYTSQIGNGTIPPELDPEVQQPEDTESTGMTSNKWQIYIHIVNSNSAADETMYP